MKRLPILLLVLLLLSVGTLVAAQAVINDERDNVTYTETLLAGDRSAAAGLTLEYSLGQYPSNRLTWDTTTTFGDTVDTETEFHYYSRDNYDKPDFRVTFFELSSGITYLDFSTFDPTGDAELPGIYALLQELYREAVPGGEMVTKIVPLSDYYEYYPINGTVNIGTRLDQWDITASRYGYSPSKAAGRTVNEYFRIPVQSDHCIRAGIRQNADGTIAEILLDTQRPASISYHWASGIKTTFSSPHTGETDNFFFATESVIADDAIYFVFSNRTQQGNTVDTSLIPGGYGIYRLPYLESAYNLSIQYGMLHTVYSIDPAAEAVALYLTDDGSRLHLITREEGGLVHTLLDMATWKELARTELPGTEGASVTDCITGDGWLAFFLDDSRLAFLTEEDGLYQLRFVTEPFGADASLDSQRTALAWNGKKLAVVTGGRISVYQGGNMYYAYASSNFTLAVYDASGLLYQGHFASSLDSAATAYDCQPRGEPPFVLTWS